MSRPAHLQFSDLDGVARLAVAGVVGVTDLVEQVHDGTARTATLRPVGQTRRTRGITGLVYRTVRGVTGLVGGALELGLGAAVRWMPAEAPVQSSDQRIRALAILNGVIGDTLEQQANPLALTMCLLDERGQSTNLSNFGVRSSSRKVAVLIHGLCLDEACWDANSNANRNANRNPARATDLPRQLAGRGWRVLRLRYNTGRPIHANGRDLAALLQDLIADQGPEIDELVLLGHSMGGLVARSAAHHGVVAGHDWTGRLGRIVCIATPHHGSPLERIGHAFDRLLASSRFSAPFARIGRLRSAGITDLRHGRIIDAPGDAAPVPILVPPHTRCYNLAATLDTDPDSLRSRQLGDGLVPVPAALGLPPDPHRTSAEANARHHVVTRTGHLAVLQSGTAVARIRRWLDD